MAIIDTDMHMTAPKGLTAASGIDAVTHALEAYASVMATDYTDGLALKALKTRVEYLRSSAYHTLSRTSSALTTISHTVSRTHSLYAMS